MVELVKKFESKSQELNDSIKSNKSLEDEIKRLKVLVDEISGSKLFTE